jgi:Flp pilus assembly pilin Flp
MATGCCIRCGIDTTLKAGRAGKETAMKNFKNLLVKLAKDENGGEVLEYALIAGLIVVAAIASITSIGTKVLARWTSLNASM